MSRFSDKVAVVTGASAGIGAATAKTLVELGLKVVGLARRKDRLDQLAKELEGKAGKLYVLKTDITLEEDIVKAFEWTTKNVGPVHVLINNAGVVPATTLVDGDIEKWKLLLDTNVLGLTIASREAIKIMRENNIDGHIININSIAGHKVFSFPNQNLYPASKHAVTALTETFRLELIRLGSKIKITSLSPGFVDTEISIVSGNVSAEQYKELLKNFPVLDSQDIADAIVYVLDTPPHVQVCTDLGPYSRIEETDSQENYDKMT